MGSEKSSERAGKLILIPLAQQSQAWYPSLLQMSKKDPFLVPKLTKLLKNLAGKDHSLAQSNSLQFVTWTVSRESFLQREYYKNLLSLLLILGDREQSLIKTWRNFCDWCSGKKIDPFGCSLASVFQFLTEQYHEGWEYNTIAGYRSAISAFHNPIDSSTIGDHPRVSAMLKRFFNLKPRKPTFPFIWDVEKILNHRNNLAFGSNLKNFTYKLVILLALRAASRGLEITHLDIIYMVKSPLFYCFTLKKPNKIMKPGDSHPKITFWGFQHIKNLYVFKVLDDYLERTGSLRDGKTNLLIAIINPHKKVALSTVFRWLNDAL